MIRFFATPARVAAFLACLAFAGTAVAQPVADAAPTSKGMALFAADSPGSDPARAPEIQARAPFFAEPPSAPWHPVALASRQRFPAAERGGPLPGFPGRLDRPPEPRT